MALCWWRLHGCYNLMVMLFFLLWRHTAQCRRWHWSTALSSFGFIWFTFSHHCLLSTQRSNHSAASAASCQAHYTGELRLIYSVYHTLSYFSPLWISLFSSCPPIKTLIFHFVLLAFSVHTSTFVARKVFFNAFIVLSARLYRCLFFTAAALWEDACWFDNCRPTMWSIVLRWV